MCVYSCMTLLYILITQWVKEDQEEEKKKEEEEDDQEEEEDKKIEEGQ